MTGDCVCDVSWCVTGLHGKTVFVRLPTNGGVVSVAVLTISSTEFMSPANMMTALIASRWFPLVLLTVANVFMTVAWYGHLKYKSAPLLLVIVTSWGIAF